MEKRLQLLGVFVIAASITAANYFYYKDAHPTAFFCKFGHLAGLQFEKGECEKHTLSQ